MKPATYIVERRRKANREPGRTICLSFETADGELALKVYLQRIMVSEKEEPGVHEFTLRKFSQGHLDWGEGIQQLDIQTLFFGDEDYILEAVAKLLAEPPTPTTPPSTP